MQNLINFVLKFKDYIVFSMLVVISLSLISLGSVGKIGGFRAVLVGANGWLQGFFAWIPNPGALQNENRALRELNLELSNEVIRMRSAVIENERLRKMIAFRDSSDQEMIPAEVIGKTSIEMRNFITLNRGRNDGIGIGMPVRTDAGLVGVINAATSDYSLVELLSNRNVKVSAKILRNNIEGIVTWEGGPYLFLINIPTSFDVVKGDIVLTSNYSNKYPKEVPIGVIDDVIKDNTSMFLKVKIRPYANPYSVEEVFVIKTLPDPERIELIKQMEENLKLQKNK